MASVQSNENRFGNLNLQQIKQRESELENKNTVSNEEKAVACFKSYLSQIGVADNDFFKYSETELNDHLSTFFFNARTKSGDYYTVGSLTTMRYGLNRALRKSGKKYDITKREYKQFLGCIDAFEAALKDLKQRGKGHVRNTPEITKKRKFSRIFLHRNLAQHITLILPSN